MRLISLLALQAISPNRLQIIRMRLEKNDTNLLSQMRTMITIQSRKLAVTLAEIILMNSFLF